MARLFRTVLLGALLFSSALQPQDQTKALTNDDIVKMVKSGMDEGLVKSIIQRAPSTQFDTSPDALIALKTAGVPQAVLAAMVTEAVPSSTTIPPTTVLGSQQVKEPEYANSVFLLESDGTLKPLERQTPSAGVKIKAMGFGGGSSSMVFNGAKSPVRISADQKPKFIVRLAAGDVDPSTLIQFFALKPTKDKRELQVGKAGFMARGAKTTMNDTAIPFSVTKYGNSSFKVIPNSSLEPGEYALSTTTSQDGYCFGVDAK